jgi:hypothetical protein
VRIDLFAGFGPGLIAEFAYDVVVLGDGTTNAVYLDVLPGDRLFAASGGGLRYVIKCGFGGGGVVPPAPTPIPEPTSTPEPEGEDPVPTPTSTPKPDREDPKPTPPPVGDPGRFGPDCVQIDLLPGYSSSLVLEYAYDLVVLGDGSTETIFRDVAPGDVVATSSGLGLRYVIKCGFGGFGDEAAEAFSPIDGRAGDLTSGPEFSVVAASVVRPAAPADANRDLAAGAAVELRVEGCDGDADIATPGGMGSFDASGGGWFGFAAPAGATVVDVTCDGQTIALPIGFDATPVSGSTGTGPGAGAGAAGKVLAVEPLVGAPDVAVAAADAIDGAMTVTTTQGVEAGVTEIVVDTVASAATGPHGLIVQSGAGIFSTVAGLADGAASSTDRAPVLPILLAMALASAATMAMSRRIDTIDDPFEHAHD